MFPDTDWVELRWEIASQRDMPCFVQLDETQSHVNSNNHPPVSKLDEVVAKFFVLCT